MAYDSYITCVLKYWNVYVIPENEIYTDQTLEELNKIMLKAHSNLFTAATI